MNPVRLASKLVSSRCRVCSYSTAGKYAVGGSSQYFLAKCRLLRSGDAWIIAGVKDWIGSTRRKTNDETEKDSLRSSHHTASMQTFVNGPKTRASAKPVPNHPPIGGNPERISDLHGESANWRDVSLRGIAGL